MTRSSASGATASRAAKSSGSRSRGRFSATRRSSSSTRRPPRSTPRPSGWCRTRSIDSRRAGRRSPLRTGSRPSATPTRSSSSTAARSSSAAATRSCSQRAGAMRRWSAGTRSSSRRHSSRAEVPAGRALDEPRARAEALEPFGVARRSAAWASTPACRRSSRSRGGPRVVVLVTVRAAAILLRLVEELDLALQQLVLEVLALQVELDLALEVRLARVALVEAALDDDSRGRKGDLPLPAEELLRLSGDLTGLGEQALLHELRFGCFQGGVAGCRGDHLRPARAGERRGGEETQVRLGHECRRGGLLDGGALVARGEDPIRDHGDAVRRRRIIELDVRRRGGIEHQPVDRDQLPLQDLALVELVEQVSERVAVVRVHERARRRLVLVLR